MDAVIATVTPHRSSDSWSDGPEDALQILRMAGSHPIVRGFPQGAIIVFDSDLRYLCAGGLGLADVGLSREVMEGRTVDEVFPPEVVAHITPLYRAALAGESTQIDVPYQGRIYTQRLGPLFDSTGTVVAGMGFTQDVTVARQFEHELAEESRRLRDAEAIGRVGSWELDLRDQSVNWSPGIFDLYGLRQEDFGGDYAEALNCIHPDDRAHVNAGVEACATDGVPFQARYRINRFDDGDLRWIDARGAAQYEGGDRVRIVGAISDVTDHVLAEVKARDDQAFQQAVIEASPDIIFVYDVGSRSTTWTNRSQPEILGYVETPGSPATASLDSIIPEEERAQFDAALAAAAAAEPGDVIQVTHRLRAADGTDHWFSRRITAFRRDHAGTVTELVGVLRDITDSVTAERQLRHSALHDNLTGLPNRALLMDRLESAVARVDRSKREICLLFCDLDGFKRVNDTGGHAAGDQVLLEMSRRLRAAVRDGDTVARIGGDEFVILIEPWNRSDDAAASREDDRAAATHISDRIRETASRPVSVNGIEHVVSLSIGVAFGPHIPAGPARVSRVDQLLQDADAAMYRAKAHGKNRFEIFHDDMRTDGVQRSRVERILRQALGPDGSSVGGERGATPPRLTADFQPIFSAASGALVAFEALARLHDAQGIAIAPDEFIRVAEECGIVGSVDTFVLHLACRQLAQWRDQSPEMGAVTMSVNVSALHVQDATFADDVHLALKRSHLAPGDLVLELTETTLLDAASSTIATLRLLHEEGIGIAIDDFGTGYASLRYLATLPISALKIDRSFTAGLPHDATCGKIVNAVAGLAADLGLTCVVEGVETTEQRNALPDGVQLQGYLTGRPQSPAVIDVNLRIG